jgi:hypothetical protein
MSKHIRVFSSSPSPRERIEVRVENNASTIIPSEITLKSID